MPKSFNDYIQALARDFTTGGVSAAISKTMNAPLERIKLINQTGAGKYKGLVDCLVRIPKEEGVLSFWRGNFANVIRYFPTQALNFAFKDFFKGLLMPKGFSGYSTWGYWWRSMLSGGGAGASSLLFVYPLDLARTRMSTDVGKKGETTYKGLGDCVSKTYKEGGIKALYKGFNISVAGIIPYRAVYFGGYDTLKRIFKIDNNTSFFFKWLVSQSNTIFAQFLTYPIDTIRRVMMLAGKVSKDGTKNPEFKSTLDATKFIYKNKGITGFFKGALANTYRATGAALCMVFYDTIQDKINPDRSK